jgi:hypothetical protein
VARLDAATLSLVASDTLVDELAVGCVDWR